MATLDPQAQTDGVRVRTTERGLPMAIRIDRHSLAGPPQQLADTIVRLCQMSAARAQVSRRRALAAQGVTSDVLRSMALSTEEDLVRAERALLDEGSDGAPVTWMRSV